MATFGYTAIGSDVTTLGNPTGSKFVAPEAGTITSIQVYLTIAAAVRVAIFADSAGSPAAKVAESGEVTPGAAGWVALSISLAITSGTTYWLMAWVEAGASDGNNAAPGDVANQTAYMTGNTYPTWPDPFNENAFLDRKLSIYAVYTASGNNTAGLIIQQA